jgi:hypothetical protein
MQTAILRSSKNVTGNILCVMPVAWSSCQELSRHEKNDTIIILEFLKHVNCSNPHNESRMSSKINQMWTFLEVVCEGFHGREIGCATVHKWAVCGYWHGKLCNWSFSATPSMNTLNGIASPVKYFLHIHSILRVIRKNILPKMTNGEVVNTYSDIWDNRIMDWL